MPPHVTEGLREFLAGWRTCARDAKVWGEEDPGRFFADLRAYLETCCGLQPGGRDRPGLHLVAGEMLRPQSPLSYLPDDAAVCEYLAAEMRPIRFVE